MANIFSTVNYLVCITSAHLSSFRAFFFRNGQSDPYLVRVCAQFLISSVPFAVCHFSRLSKRKCCKEERERKGETGAYIVCYKILIRFDLIESVGWQYNNTDNCTGKWFHISSEFVMLTRINGIFYVSFWCWPIFPSNLSSLSTFIGLDCDAVPFGLRWTDRNDQTQNEWQNEVIPNRNVSSYCFTWIVRASHTRFVVANSGSYFSVVEQQLSRCTKYRLSCWNLFLVS